MGVTGLKGGKGEDCFEVVQQSTLIPGKKGEPGIPGMKGTDRELKYYKAKKPAKELPY